MARKSPAAAHPVQSRQRTPSRSPKAKAKAKADAKEPKKCVATKTMAKRPHADNDGAEPATKALKPDACKSRVRSTAPKGFDKLFGTEVEKKEVSSASPPVSPRLEVVVPVDPSSTSTAAPPAHNALPEPVAGETETAEPAEPQDPCKDMLAPAGPDGQDTPPDQDVTLQPSELVPHEEQPVTVPEPSEQSEHLPPVLEELAGAHPNTPAQPAPVQEVAEVAGSTQPQESKEADSAEATVPTVQDLAETLPQFAPDNKSDSGSNTLVTGPPTHTAEMDDAGHPDADEKDGHSDGHSDGDVSPAPEAFHDHDPPLLASFASSQEARMSEVDKFMQWPTHLLRKSWEAQNVVPGTDTLDYTYTDYVDHMANRMDSLSLSTAFSGIDTPGVALEMLSLAVAGELAPTAPLDVDLRPQILNLWGIEWFSKSRHELERSTCGPMHLFSDMSDFWSDVMQRKITGLMEQGNLAEVMMKLLKTTDVQHMVKSCAFCVKCNKECPVAWLHSMSCMSAVLSRS